MTQWGLDTLFNPAKRHMDEEKQRLQSTREQVGDSSGGRRIDLESGKVVIARTESESESESETESDTGSGAGSGAQDERDGGSEPTADAVSNGGRSGAATGGTNPAGRRGAPAARKPAPKAAASSKPDQPESAAMARARARRANKK